MPAYVSLDGLVIQDSEIGPEVANGGVQCLADEPFECLSAIGSDIRVVKAKDIDLRKRSDRVGSEQMVFDVARDAAPEIGEPAASLQRVDRPDERMLSFVAPPISLEHVHGNARFGPLGDSFCEQLRDRVGVGVRGKIRGAENQDFAKPDHAWRCGSGRNQRNRQPRHPGYCTDHAEKLLQPVRPRQAFLEETARWSERSARRGGPRAVT